MSLPSEVGILCWMKIKRL